MWHNLSKIFTALSTDPSVRAILFTGAGRAFTAGLDVTAASSSATFDATTAADSARRAFGLRRHILEFQECISALEIARLLSPASRIPVESSCIACH